MHDHHGHGRREKNRARIALTLALTVVYMLAELVGGWLADRWMRVHPRGRIFVSAIGMSLIVPAIFGVGNAGSLTVADERLEEAARRIASKVTNAA